LPRPLCQGLFAEASLPRPLCRGLFAKASLPRPLCRDLFAETSLPRPLYQGPNRGMKNTNTTIVYQVVCWGFYLCLFIFFYIQSKRIDPCRRRNPGGSRTRIVIVINLGLRSRFLCLRGINILFAQITNRLVLFAVFNGLLIGVHFVRSVNVFWI